MLEQLAVDASIINAFKLQALKKSDISRLGFFMDWPAEHIRLSAGEVNHFIRVLVSSVCPRWSGVAVARWSRSTKLTHVGPG